MNQSWKIQNIKCVYGNCISQMDNMDAGDVSMIFTDPPYLMGYQSNYRSKDAEDSKTEKLKQKEIKADTLAEGKKLIRRFYDRAYRVLFENSFMYVCFKPDGKLNGNYVDLGHVFKGEAIRAGFDIRNTIIWKKNNWTAGDLKGAFGFQYESILLCAKGNPKLRGKRHTDVWEFDRVSDGSRIHPNQKPVPLIARAIESSSIEGDLILDPFAGSGTTGIAAYELGRESVLIEYDRERYDAMLDYVEMMATPKLF